MGRGALFRSHKREKTDSSRAVEELVAMAEHLSRRKVGALVVFEQKTGLRDVIETGTAVDSLISAPLLENIFEPNTPLHDGAVIIRGDRVMAGACILPLTENRGVSRDLGTRHRASLGVSESTDAVVLIVSEETGIISMAHEGKLTRHLDAKSMREVLDGVFDQPRHTLPHLFHISKKPKEDAQ